MSSFEPYWDVEKSKWPGLYDSQLKRIKGDVTYDTHIGTWCEWQAFGGQGVCATNEFQFADNGRFVWFTLGERNGHDVMFKREGTWKLTGDNLELQIESSDEPDVMPRLRADLKIGGRTGELQFTKVRMDDEVRDKGFCSYSLLPARAGDSIRVLEAAQKKTNAPEKLPKPFSLLEMSLSMAIPAAIKKLKLSDPAFCLRLYFYDTHAPRENFGLRVRVMTEPLRELVVSKSPANLDDELWCPQSGAANGTPGEAPGLYELDLSGSKELAKYFGEVYDLLERSEDENMPHLRELVRRVCKKLNALKWSTYTPITDDFVVFPADGSGFFGDDYLDDLAASVPAERISLLRERGYLG